MAQYTQSKSSYNPKADSVRTPAEKISRSFTPHQFKLLHRSDVTKSLILALSKVFDFTIPLDEVISDWVGGSTQALIANLPNITAEV
jgi:hypothetical protein